MIENDISDGTVCLTGQIERVPHGSPPTGPLSHIVCMPERVHHAKVLADEQHLQKVQRLDAMPGRVGLLDLNVGPRFEHQPLIKALPLQVNHLVLLAQVERGHKIWNQLAFFTKQLSVATRLVVLYGPKVVPFGHPKGRSPLLCELCALIFSVVPNGAFQVAAGVRSTHTLVLAETPMLESLTRIAVLEQVPIKQMLANEKLLRVVAQRGQLLWFGQT